MSQIDTPGLLRLLCAISIFAVIIFAILFSIEAIMERTLMPLLMVVLLIILILPNERGNILKRVPLPLIFLCLAFTIPFVHLYDPNPPVYETPPPGFSSNWWYYLLGDYDYFFRLRFLPISIPFWIITGAITLQMNARSIPKYSLDFLIHLAIGCVLSVIWWFLSMGIVSGISTWVTAPNAITPLIGIPFVAVHRAINWTSTQSGLE